MKKIFFLLCLLPLSIWGQKAQNQARTNERKAITLEIDYSDTMSFKNAIIKTDTSVLFFELIINPNRLKPYLEDVAKSDTLCSSKKLGVLEFFVTEYPLKNWAEFKKQATTQKSEDVINAEAEKQRQDRYIKRKEERDKILKADKN